MPRPKKKYKPLAVWVTRDDFELNENTYNIYIKKSDAKATISDFGRRVYWNDTDDIVCPHIFEKHFFKLKPGAGPVKCEIEIRRIK